MSFLVCHIQKYKQNNVCGIQKHIQRENKNYSNKDVDSNRSNLNYDLVNANKINFTERIKDIIDSQRKSKKAIRKDAVLMAEAIVTSDKEFFKNLSEDKQKKFFDESLKFFNERFGEQNIINATVHLDETTPHMHLNFVPMDQEGHLSAKRVITRVALKKLQNDLPERLQKCGFDIKRGIEYSPAVHEDTRDFKRHQEESKKIVFNGVKHFFDEIDKIQQGARKSAFRDKIKLSSIDFNTLVKLAKTASSLYEDNVELKNKLYGFNEQISVALKRIKSKANSDIENAKIHFIDKLSYKSLFYENLALKKKNEECKSTISNLEDRLDIALDDFLNINAELKLLKEKEKNREKNKQMTRDLKSDLIENNNALKKENEQLLLKHTDINNRLKAQDDEIERYKKANTKLRNKLHKTEEMER